MCRGPPSPVVSKHVDSAYCRLTASICGLILMICGIVSITSGGLILKYRTVDTDSPWNGGHPIWAGAIAFLAGLFALILGIQMIKIDVRRVFFYVTFGFSIAVTSTNGQLIGMAVTGYNGCTGTPKDYCLINQEKLTDLSVIAMSMGVINMLAAIGLLILYIVVNCKIYRECKAEGCGKVTSDESGKC